jgi:hypothetical protein
LDLRGRGDDDDDDDDDNNNNNNNNNKLERLEQFQNHSENT